ncbi:redoxin family protein [Terriglobus sp. RCC_193]|uniref:redoxin family protein n=1 Tax=Terriglobus sp. RCC_193 TaxID=3239218 RepID=UPI0035232D66
MARTESNTELSLGAVCPAFELECVLCNKALGRDDIYAGPDDPYARKGLLVAFISVHCPFVKHMEVAFTALAKKYAREIATVCICSNDEIAFPDDGPAGMREQGKRLGWDKGEGCTIPYLHDDSQETAREFHAACTPDLYLFDQDRKLVYHAQFDRTRPYRESDAKAGVERHPEIHQAAHGADLEAAIKNLITGNPPLAHQVPSLGCNIKWKS